MPRPPDDVDALVERATRGRDRYAVSRLITIAENGGVGAATLSRALTRRRRTAYTIGITGAPGAGKSTLTSQIIRTIRETHETVAVVAVDPTSPRTGGAVLGDRIRMEDHTGDRGVFIRSMATRGELGGLSRATQQALNVLATSGWPWLLVETVGVGQIEVDVVALADTTIVLVNPGWGDAIQIDKAGLLEIGDIVVVNKADRPGSEQARLDLLHGLDDADATGWVRPIVSTVAESGLGIAELWGAVWAHRRHLEGNGTLETRRAQRVAAELRRMMKSILDARSNDPKYHDALAEAVERVTSSELDTVSAAELLLRALSEAPVDTSPRDS